MTADRRAGVRTEAGDEEGDLVSKQSIRGALKIAFHLSSRLDTRHSTPNYSIDEARQEIEQKIAKNLHHQNFSAKLRARQMQQAHFKRCDVIAQRN